MKRKRLLLAVLLALMAVSLFACVAVDEDYADPFLDPLDPIVVSIG